MSHEDLIDQYASEYELRLDSGEKPDQEQFVSESPVMIQERLREKLQRIELKRTRIQEFTRGITTVILSKDPNPSSVQSRNDNPALSDSKNTIEPETSQELEGRNEADVPMPQIHRYDFVRLIGAGGFGQVYEARDRILHKRVAVKVMRLNDLIVQTSNESQIKSEMSILQEAWHLAELRHEHIVQVHDAGKNSDGNFFVVTDFIDGTTLREYIKKKMLDDKEIVSIISSIASALHHAHSNRIAHRDIKPENILVDHSGKPYLVDFGLALHEDDYGMTPSMSGTVSYMSPEQASGNAHLIDGRSDIFSLGIVFYEMLRGVRPFRGGNPLAILEQIRNQDPAPIRQGRQIAPELERICMKCLEKNQKDRYLSAKDLADDLQEFLKTLKAESHSFVRNKVAKAGLICTAGVIFVLSSSMFSTIETIPDNNKEIPVSKRPITNIVPIDSIQKTINKSVTPLLALYNYMFDNKTTFEVAQTESDVTVPATIANRSEETDNKPVVSNENNDSMLLANQALAVFEKYCRKCHHDEDKYHGLDLLNHEKLLAFKNKDQDSLIVQGNLEKSELWFRISGDDKTMPPKDKPQPRTAEIEIIQKWIEAGAPAWKVESHNRQRIELDAQFQAIIDDLNQCLPDERKSRRYFSLLHLYNDPEVTDGQLALTKAAVSKLVNSLSWKGEIKAPKEIGKNGILLAIDLRDYGWDKNKTWPGFLLVADPYQLSFQSSSRLSGLQSTIDKLVDIGIPQTLWVRADWFIANASRPPLYHEILELPKTANELEKQLKVDVISDFRENRIKRAGFIKSGVSTQNRLIDRHQIDFGAYWKSYDFAPKRERSDLMNYPLGPPFANHPFANLAFEHDGGEIIFNLPNGLQGYYLATSAGSRIDLAPIDIVQDSFQVGGTAAIVNGLSCMNCHWEGIKPFQDDLLKQAKFEGVFLEKIRSLVPTLEQMNQQVQADQQRFRASTIKAMSGYYKTTEIRLNSIEPIGTSTQTFNRDISLNQLGHELFQKDTKEIENLIKYSDKVKFLGLEPLLHGGLVRRNQLQSPASINGIQSRTGATVFQILANELGIGNPVNVSENQKKDK